MSVLTILRSRRRSVVAATGAIATLAAGCVPGQAEEDPAAGCGSVVLHVVAAPEIAPVVTEAATAVDGCARVEVTATDPAKAAEEIDGAGRVDVWIPDSSRWISAAPEAAGALAGEAASIASSPAVVAVTAQLAGALGPRPTYDALAAAGVTQPLTAADPKTSAVTQAVMADVGGSLRSTPHLRGQFAAMLRGLQIRPAGLAPDAAVQVTTEQQVRAANTAAGSTAFVAVHAAETGRSLDYPFVVATYESSQIAAAEELLANLTSPATRAELERLGFRTGDRDLRPLSAEDADTAIAALGSLARPTRLLAAVDVSGSMLRPVPGTGGLRRIDLAREALREGIRLFPDRTVAGLWRFSANLTPSTDYEQVVPLTEILPHSRQQVAAATDGLRVKPNGGTGLYATTLAAVRAVRAGYDASRVNSVLVISDGRDEKAESHHIELSTLLSTLQAEDDPERPVIVNMIAYGPDSDAGAMQQVARATGGTVYHVRDPREIGTVFRDAIGNRLCSGAC